MWYIEGVHLKGGTILNQSRRPLLITGGSGYLGACLVRVAATRWPIVATFHRHPDLVPDVDTVSLDIRDAAATTRLLETVRPFAVIHTAVSTIPDEMDDVIIGGTENVARAATQVGARLVHLSTDVAFDGEESWYQEDDPLRPVHAYGRAKAAAEKVVAAIGRDYVIVRTSLITGFVPPDPRTAWVLDSIRQRQPITLFTDEFRCPIWVYDLAEACLQLAESSYTGILHVAGPEALSRYELGVLLARLRGLDPADGITHGLLAKSGLSRPRDCTLDINRARHLLNMRWHTIRAAFLQETHRNRDDAGS